MSDGKASPKKIKVVDRRWFNEEGELRSPASRPVEGKTREGGQAAGPPAGVPPKREAPPGGAQTEAPPPGSAARQNGAAASVQRPSGAELSLIIDILAQQAVVFLTGAQGVEKNTAQARLFIDLLDILQEKTEGRLTPEEAAYLRDVLTRLRLAFVESGP